MNKVLREVIKVLTCKLMNARSIVNKMLELEEMVYEEDPDIILITESWTNSYIPLAEIHIPGYEIIRKDRVNRKDSGCVAYFREDIRATALE